MPIIKKIGIVTWHYYQNYGSQLQAYGLLKTLRDMGYEARILNYRSPKYDRSNLLKRFVEKIALIFPMSFWDNVFPRLKLPERRFRKIYNETKISHSAEDLEHISREFDAIICGSDQIWAPNVFNPVYLLNFVPKGIRKVSYAASIGLDSIPDVLVSQYNSLLSSFNAVSVREKQGARILKELCGIDSEVVLDPTLLVDAAHWSSISVTPQLSNSPYIFCYFLKEDHQYSKAVINYAQANGLRIIAVSANKSDSQWARTYNYSDVGPREFLGLIKGADSVFTDSYHGTIFSILFHKRFLTFQRFHPLDKLCQNSRIIQLSEYFNCSDKIVVCNESTKIRDITMLDWVDTEGRLEILRAKSIAYLNKALSQC